LSVASLAAASGEEAVPFDISRAHQPVFHALVDARTKYGADTPALIDGDERVLTYEEIIRAALALGHALKKGTRSGESVGIMLPTGAGSVIAFFAVSAYGRVPTMMNFTAGLAGIRSALRTAKVKKIVTARRFVELAKAEHIVEAMQGHYDIVYLEDVRENLSLIDKLYAAVGTFLPSLVASHALHSTPAVILFTSGTEGEPKGDE